MNYVKKVTFMKQKRNDLREFIEVQNEVKTSKKGTYDVIYRIARENGDYGVTRLIVVVK